MKSKNFTLSIELDNWKEIKLEHPYPRFTISIWVYVLTLLVVTLATNLVELNLFILVMKSVALVEVILLVNISNMIEGYESCMKNLVHNLTN